MAAPLLPSFRRSDKFTAAVARRLATATAPLPPVTTARLETGDARWWSRVPLPSGAKAEPTRAHLPPHQVHFSGWPPTSTPAAGAQWTPSSRRTGVLAMKAGMTADWDSWGVRRALTVLKLEDVIVTAVIREAERGYNALQLGAGIPRPKELDRALHGQFDKLRVAPRSHLAEFRVTPEAFLPPGTPLLAQHFVPGQHVTVTGTSQGKGFQGAMKRHGFKGQGASHGNSVSHRVLGSTGQRQDPGKVIKGKKMPGQMGGVTVTMDGLRVYKVDVKHNLLYVEGAVPGKPGSYLRVADSKKRTASVPPPFPTYQLTDADRTALALWSVGAYGSHVEEAEFEASGLKLPYTRQPPHEYVVQPPAVDPFAIPEDDEPEPQ